MTSGNNTYRAYTFRISSPIQLPGLQQAIGDPDITIEYGCIDSNANNYSAEDKIQLSYDGIGTFEIHNGRRVVVDPAEEIGDTVLLTYLIGPVLSAVLYQRGYLVLHASSVSIRDSAVVFLGPSGAGKSTLAAACRVRGHDVLSDDITAVSTTAGEPAVAPGLPFLKLTPESSEVFDMGEKCFSSGPGNKNLYRIPSGVPQSTQPLKRLYVVTDGELQCKKTSPGEAIQALVGHTYTESLLNRDSLGDHFRQCTHVADNTEISWLSRPKDFDRLSDTVQQIEREFD